MPLPELVANGPPEGMLRALYYPFSRCIEPTALKQLLLVFDEVTFLDPVEDNEWRAQLMRGLEVQEDERFARHREIEREWAVLEHEGAVVRRDPQEFRAATDVEATAGALSDLADPTWCQIASSPRNFGLPHQSLGPNGTPSWHAFPDKLPPRFRDLLLDARHQRHIVRHGSDSTAWVLSYAAGSAAALNVHLAVAGALGLATVTDSSMHHRLLVRKAVRASTPESRWTEPQSMVVEASVRNAAIRLVEELAPKE